MNAPKAHSIDEGKLRAIKEFSNKLFILQRALEDGDILKLGEFDCYGVNFLVDICIESWSANEPVFSLRRRADFPFEGLGDESGPTYVLVHGSQ